MGAYLQADADGPTAGQRFDLEAAESILGRHPECHVVIEAGAVSRHHAKIVREADAYFLEDLKSRNFTFLNDHRVSERERLKHGDRISVCDVRFTFQLDPPPADAVPPEADDSKGLKTLFVDDESDSSGSTIMSKLGVTASSRSGGLQLQASPEAKLAALLEITRSLGRALALDEVLPQVLDSLFKIFVQADRGFVALHNEKGELIPRWHHSRRPDAEDTIRVSRTIVNLVMETQEAILSMDAANDERLEMSQSIADFRIRSMMCAPLVDSEAKTIGVIQIDTLDQRKKFQPEDLEVLVAVAAQAGVAINNAQLHDAALRQRAVERDLALAHEVQKGFLPDRRPDISEYRFFDYYEPFNHVGGDYYDYIPLPNDKLAIVVADVVGHGVAAALMMAKLSAETRYCLASESTPAEAMTVLNERLSGLQIDRFVTMILVVLDPHGEELTIVNAGHMPPMIYRTSDSTLIEPRAEDEGLPLGVLSDTNYDQVTAKLDPGDVVTLFTDGINEGQNENDEQFGMERIKELIRASNGDPAAIGPSVVQAVREFLNGEPQEDDMCLVVFGREGGE